MTSTHELTENVQHKPEGPVGLGGWLILPILGLCGTILMTGYNLVSVMDQWGGVEAIVRGSNATAEALRLPVALSFAFGVGIVIFAGVCLRRIFSYSPTVPRLMTIFYLALVALTLAEVGLDKMISDTLGTDMDPGNLTDVARVLVAAAIWIPYFNNSRRVANTFHVREAAVEKKIGEIF